MFQAHLITCLQGKHKNGSLMLPPDMKDSKRAERQLILEKLKVAQAFDFGTLLLEESDEPGYYRSPKITSEEMQFWIDGLLPFPYPCCWYEFSMEVEGGVHKHPVRDDENAKIGILFWEHENGGYGATGFTSQGEGGLHLRWTGIINYVDRKLGEHPGTLVGRLAGSEWMDAAIKRERDKGEISPTERAIDALPSQILYLTLMLNSKTTEVSMSKPVHWFHRQRLERKGLWVPTEHRMVNIVPDRFKRFAEDQVKGTHASPRLHWRRSHLRHHASGKVSVVSRCLVGAPEKGSISHSYRIIGSPKATPPEPRKDL